MGVLVFGEAWEGGGFFFEVEGVGLGEREVRRGWLVWLENTKGRTIWAGRFLRRRLSVSCRDE